MKGFNPSLFILHISTAVTFHMYSQVQDYECLWGVRHHSHLYDSLRLAWWSALCPAIECVKKKHPLLTRKHFPPRTIMIIIASSLSLKSFIFFEQPPCNMTKTLHHSTIRTAIGTKIACVVPQRAGDKEEQEGKNIFKWEIIYIFFIENKGSNVDGILPLKLFFRQNKFDYHMKATLAERMFLAVMLSSAVTDSSTLCTLCVVLSSIKKCHVV